MLFPPSFHTFNNRIENYFRPPRSTSSESKTPQKDFLTPPTILNTLSILNTPIELRHKPIDDTPSPVQAGLKYRLGRIEKEYSDLQQFTALETRFDLYPNAEQKDSYINKLEMDLKIAREEVEKYRQLSYGKLADGVR